MRMKLAAMGLLAASAVVAPLSASASMSQCGSDHMCVWGNDNYDWLLANQIHGQVNWFDPFGAGQNNEDQSWANRSSTYTGCVADGAYGSGGTITLSRNGEDPNLAVWNDNQGSSMRTAYGC
jgi:hypothetical protein